MPRLFTGFCVRFREEISNGFLGANKTDEPNYHFSRINRKILRSFKGNLLGKAFRGRGDSFATRSQTNGSAFECNTMKATLVSRCTLEMSIFKLGDRNVHNISACASSRHQSRRNRAGGSLKNFRGGLQDAHDGR